MPRYDFLCKNCKSTYEESVPWDATGKYKKVRCPACKSRRKEKLASSCAFSFSNPVGTDRWNNSSTGHDYRYKHKAPAIREQRAMAENKSHMGKSEEIYRAIDDTKRDSNFDFGKI